MRLYIISQKEPFYVIFTFYCWECFLVCLCHNIDFYQCL